MKGKSGVDEENNESICGHGRTESSSEISPGRIYYIKRGQMRNWEEKWA